MRIVSLGHAVFAATMIALGILGLVQGNFAPVWDPVPKGVPAREALVYLCAFVSLACGTGLFWPRTAGPATRVLLGYLLLWFVLFRMPNIVLSPTVEVSWSGGAETAVMVAGAWILYARFAGDWDKERFGFATGEKGRCMATAIYGLSLIPFGLAHFVYLRETASLVPGWLPSHVAWAYFTGAAFIAAGVALITGICARLAAALSTLQLGLFTLLVWVPIVATGSANPFQWNETVLSAALTTGAWVVANSFRGMPWRIANRRQATPAI